MKVLPNRQFFSKNPGRMKKMYENVKSETITISKEEYDTLKRERDEYRSVALDLSRILRSDSA